MIYENIVKEYLDEMIKKYNLKYEDVTKNSALLMGEKFAFYLTIHLGKVYLEYITLYDNEYTKIDIWNYCVSHFNANDRKNLPVGDTVENNIRCNVLILARGLENHFKNMLEGNIDWLDDYKKYPLAAPIRKVDDKIVKLIKSVDFNC